MVEVIVWILVAIAVIAIDIVTSSFIFMWFSLGAISRYNTFFTWYIGSMANYCIFSCRYSNCFYWISLGKEKI